jgi:hypothetical protein
MGVSSKVWFMGNLKIKKVTHMLEPSCFAMPLSDWLGSNWSGNVDIYEEGVKYECYNDSGYCE